MILWKWNSCFFCRTRLVPLSCCLGKISLSLLFPAPLQSWGEFQPSQCWVKMCFEITAHFWEVYGYTVCSVFCKICDPSQMDKLFEQLKQDHIHTLPVTWVQAFVPHHFVLLFICVPTERGNVEKQGFCQCIFAFMNVLMSLCCFHLALQDISIFFILMSSWTRSSFISLLFVLSIT